MHGLFYVSQRAMFEQSKISKLGAQDLDTGLWRINLRKENQQPQQAV
jgi:hypothetical protein